MPLEQYNCRTLMNVPGAWVILARMAGEPKVWTKGRKLAGNLVPLLSMVPTGVRTALAYRDRGWDGDLWMVWLAVTLGIGWVALNFFGFWRNAAMRNTLRRRFESTGTPISGEVYFVGVATPAFRDALDPHEDVGFLLLGDDELRFVGETQRIAFARGEVDRVRFRANVHTLLGLGGWARLEGERGGDRWHLYVEPRERTTLVLNAFYGVRFRRRLRAWVGSK